MPHLTAISPEQFADKAWKHSAGYSFAIRTNILPVVAAELTHLVPAMPLGFVQNGDTFQMVAITSLQPNTNVYVPPDGRWLGSYIPSTLRSYPFCLVKLQDSEKSVLCIDEGSGLLVNAGQGAAFFDDFGAPTQAVRDVVEFLTHIERSRLLTQAAVDALHSAGLIQPWPINVQNGDQTVIGEGLFHINEATLNALPVEGFLKLRHTGALSVAYAQLLSMNQLSILENLSRIQAQIKAQAVPQIKALTGLKGFRMSQEEGTIKFNF